MTASYFWAYETDLPGDVGFSLLSPEHFLWLAFFAVFTFVFCRSHRQKQGARRTAAETAVALIPLIMEILQAIWLIAIGHMTVATLPLHLCDFSVAVLVLYLLTGWDFWAQILWTLGLPGAMFALIFCDWTVYPAFGFMSICGFFIHGFMVASVADEVAAGRLRPDPKRFWMPIVYLAVLVPPVLAFDRHFDVNYMFINWPIPDTPLELYADWFGNPGYLFPTALTALAVILVMYLPFWIRNLRTVRAGRPKAD